MKDKSNQQDKDTKEGPNLQVAGPGGEITAGMTIMGWNNIMFSHSNLAVHFFYATILGNTSDFSKMLFPCQFWFSLERKTIFIRIQSVWLIVNLFRTLM
jgi:hypothetical protein